MASGNVIHTSMDQDAIRVFCAAKNCPFSFDRDEPRRETVSCYSSRASYRTRRFNLHSQSGCTSKVRVELTESQVKEHGASVVTLPSCGKVGQVDFSAAAVPTLLELVNMGPAHHHSLSMLSKRPYKPVYALQGEQNRVKARNESPSATAAKARPSTGNKESKIKRARPTWTWQVLAQAPLGLKDKDALKAMEGHLRVLGTVVSTDMVV